MSDDRVRDAAHQCPPQWSKATNSHDDQPGEVADLRHTYATLLLARGTHPTYVQKSLRHASVQLTLDRYSHWMPSMSRNTADEIDEALG
jgi:integrase